MTTSKWNIWAGVGCLLIGSLAQLAQYLVTPVSGGSEAAEQLAQAAGHLSAMRWAVVLDVPLMLVIPAVLYIGLVAGAKTSRLAAAGMGFAFVSMLGGIFLLANDVLLYEAGNLGSQSGVSALVEAYQNNGVITGLVIFYLLGHLIGLILLAVALWRAGSVPTWAAVVLALSPVFEMVGVGGDVKVVGAVGYAFFLLTCLACSFALLGMDSKPGVVTQRAGVSSPAAS